ncbi:MAG: FAD-dependent oxidoreductase [Rhodospirillales bacterium]|nr:FAD-dependent oxidoreductase [Rhodospirillales bacterium]MBT4041616.1 FAD-dependent oxidoreductase [Rhodospirillales bacterium]MBT4625329.1 FAD-dependent oxidoreductase [Rhodospirillales bacterium]MBT5351902.1 FAD-dependent oxidoreductase [Rhodospirillales bacterium]MBT5521576.1 FAD-dependent oxidoreductase [Rhodospirillales bacterium]
MSDKYPTLFTPIKLRHRELRNRIVFGAHTINMGQDGLPKERHFGYYRERARGGAGMIVVEPSPAHRTGVLTNANFRHEDDSVIPAFRRITDECHDEGATIVHQLYHVGAHGDQDNSWEPYWSPSGTASMHDPWGSHAMTENEINELVESFIQAARRDHESGFDGVDLFSGYNCLIDQFWSPITNRRDDKWGGSLENRLRFSVEICEGIRKVAGDDFIIGMTISGAEPYPGGLSMDDKLEIVSWLDARGLVDYYSIGNGSYLNRFAEIVPSFHFGMKLTETEAEQFKNTVSHALITAEARVKTPENAEEVLSAGHADMVSIVRGQIADPHLANKAKEGRAEDIRPCISCNQLCLGRRLRDYWGSCLVNPSVGREHEWDGDTTPPTIAPKEILVVGAGPAGMEVARMAAARGHKVRLVERLDEIGGQFRLAAGQPERGEIGGLISWYQTQLEKLQVRIDLRTELSAEDIRNSGADEVVLCTGSNPSRTGFQRSMPHRDTLPGVDQDNVCTVHDVLDGSFTPGTNVLLLDDINGWLPASLTALHLALQRHVVTVVTAADVAAGQMEASHTASTTRERFWKYGVEVLTSTALMKWEGNTATLLHLYADDEEKRDFDTLVLATTNTPEDKITHELAADHMVVHTIGDAVSARTASMAFFEARKLGMSL